MQTSYEVPLYSKIFRIVARPIFRLLFFSITRVKIIGKENIPQRGPYLIVYNHVSLFEPPFLLTFWPTFPEIIGAVEIFHRKGQSTLAKLYNTIPVHRGEYDRKLINTIFKILESGYPLAIAPEGGRSHTHGMRRAKPGIAFILEREPVPIVPVGIEGTSDDLLELAFHGKPSKLVLHIGKPFQLQMSAATGNKRKLVRQYYADQVMLHIAELLPEEYWGVYKEKILDFTKNR